MSKRRAAREFAMKVLYQIDICRTDHEAVIELLQEECDLSALSLSFVRELVQGALEHRESIDELINTCAENWSLERMPAIDRNILRMAVHEMLYMPDIPHNVTINEAIELANAFSTVDSGRFVNGILDSIFKKKCSDT